MAVVAYLWLALNLIPYPPPPSLASVPLSPVPIQGPPILQYLQWKVAEKNNGKRAYSGQKKALENSQLLAWY